MEEKEKVRDARVCEGVEELQERLKELSKELEDQKLLVSAYRREADRYKEWWFKESKKRKTMKEDIEDIKKLTNKITERW